MDSVKAQTLRSKEIFVVDGYSTDQTAEIAQETGATVVQSYGNRSVARNIGLKRSSASTVLFVDSDMILPSTLLEECQSELHNHDALIIPEISVGIGFWAMCKSLERRTYYEDNLVEAARCFTRSAISSVGGFDSRLGAGEDWDLQCRIESAGYTVGRVRSTMTHDEGHPSLASLVRKKFVYGKSMGAYLRANPSTGFRRINPLRRVIFPSMKAFPESPVHGIGIFILKTLEFSGAGVGYIIGTENRTELRAI